MTAILDQEKPDPGKIAAAKVNADAPQPNGLSGTKLAQFYYDRGNARAYLARNRDALADGKKAIEVGKGTIDLKQVSRIMQFVGMQYQSLGDPKRATETYQEILRNGNQPGVRGTMINSSRNIAQALIQLGDVTQADAFARRVSTMVSEARGSPHPSWRSSYPIYGNSWESDNDTSRAMIFEARGQYKEAEAAYVRAERFRRASLKDLSKFEYAPPPGQVVINAEHLLMSVARVKAKQGRMSEAESDARKALLSVLKAVGKYHPSQPTFSVGLANILVEQGRYAEAEKLSRSALEVQRALGIADDLPTSASIFSQLGGILTLLGKDKEAVATYAELEKVTEKWEPQRREVFLLNGSRVTALYAAGQVDAGIAAAQALVKKQVSRSGENHFDTAAARGTLGLGLALARRDAEAIKEFKAAIPAMMAASRENADDDDTTAIVSRSRALQTVVEAYIGALSRTSSKEYTAETFELADAVRGRSVQQALTASSARMTAKEPKLAELVRTEQDLAKQIGAQLGTLNNILTLPQASGMKIVCARSMHLCRNCAATATPRARKSTVYFRLTPI